MQWPEQIDSHEEKVTVLSLGLRGQALELQTISEEGQGNYDIVSEELQL